MRQQRGNAPGVGRHLPPDGMGNPVGLLVQLAVGPRAAVSGGGNVIGKARRDLLEARRNGPLDIGPCKWQDGRCYFRFGVALRSRPP